jgi:hypothetical protein
MYVVFMGYKTIALGVILLNVIARTEAQQPERRQPKLVSIGEISRFSAATQSFDLRSERKVSNEPTIHPEDARIGIGIGQIPPRRGDDRPLSNGRPDLSDPRIANDDPFEGRGEIERRQRVEILTTKVFLTKETVCKDRKKTLLCSELTNADKVIVTGDERREGRGKGLYASEVVRTSPGS